MCSLVGAGRKGLAAAPPPVHHQFEQSSVFSDSYQLEREAMAESELLLEEEEDEDEEWEDLDETQLYLRSKFYESWLWMQIKLPDKPGRDGSVQ